MYGIYLQNSDNNCIYHNNFVNNSTHAYDDGSNDWDNGYPSGGNYWSDYAGADNYRGENQNILGSDGIGDTPYYILGDNNRDRYPLMSPVAQPLGMVSYWKFDEGSENIAYDNSGYGNHGTIYGATWTAGKIGGALHFDGDDYVLVPNSPSLEIADELTLEAWIKVQYFQDSVILRKGYRFSEVSYGLHFWDPERMVSFNVGASIYDDIAAREISLELDKWYHIAGTYVKRTGEWKIYVNGVLENSLTRPGELAVNSAPIYIGSHYNTAFFRGVIDEIRIYNRALSPDEILQHYLGIIGATIDINPDTLNLRSRGRWITCYIELPSGYSVENIDVGTVMLLVDNDNVPAEAWPTGIGDHDNDDIADRMVKFSRSAVQALASIGEFEATVVGEAAGMPFEGSDTIRVIDFGTDTLYKARLGVDLNLDNGQGLALRFYAYSGALQGENVLWDGVAPAHVVFIENVPHPDGRPIEDVALVLTDNTENIISTIASFTVTKVMLEIRFSEIPLDWLLAQPAERTALEMEFSEIPLYWLLAPD